jgi:uncharacterized protein involved in type VI secretion and phage assembly
MQEQVATLPHRGANQSRYFFTLTGDSASVRVIAFDTRAKSPHALSTSYDLELTVAAGRPLDGAALLNQKGRFSLLGEGSTQELHGLVTEVTAKGRNLDSFEYRLRLSSPLYPLTLNRRSRVFRNRNVLDIAEEVLRGGGFSKQMMQFQTRHDYPVREFVSQFQESDYDFISRQLAHWGLFFHFIQTADDFKLVIRDNLYELPELPGTGHLAYREQSGQSRGAETLYQLQTRSRGLTRAVSLTDHNYRTPGVDLGAQRSSASEMPGKGADYPYIDEQGRYKVRLAYDLSGAEATQASHWVRMMQPYGGDNHGQHYPLHGGTEVALGHHNGDPDRPFILGALPNPNTPSPVNADNPSQHILRTWGGNELLFEDRAGQERIELFTRERKNILTLDARKEAHQIRLASEQGDMKIEAGKTILQHSGDSHTLESGNDHEVTVENNQRLMTKNKAIQLDAATDIEFKAKQHIRAQAEAQDVEIKAGRNSVQTTERDASWEVKQGDMKLQVESGRFELRVAKAITLLGEGGGNIHLGQAGCNFEIDTGGNLNLSGNTFNANFKTINLKGQNIGNN